VVPNLRFIGLYDRGTLRRVRICLTTPFMLPIGEADAVAPMSGNTATISSLSLLPVFLSIFLRNFRGLQQRCATDARHHLSFQR
jgi:hypothetical protein